MSEEVGIRTVARQNGDMAVFTDSGVTLFDVSARAVTFDRTMLYSPGTTRQRRLCRRRADRGRCRRDAGRFGPPHRVRRRSRHAGVLVSGRLGSRRVIALSGRAHLYEGHAPADVTFGMRVLGALGVPCVILTNAAGGINASFATGALMLIDDHINLMGRNPLVGPHDPRLGPRFPDMTEIYSRRLRGLAGDAAAASGIRLEHGIYVAVLGPSYETPAEIRAFRTLGADAVGMSTAPEAIVARHMGVEVLGISCITNPAAGVVDRPLHHDEVMAVAARVRGEFIALLEGIIERL